MKYQKLKAKRFILVPVLHEEPDDIPLSYHDLLLYGYLLYRARKDQGATQAEVARVLGLDQLRTVPASRDRLLNLGLIERRDRLYALPPPESCQDWFRLRHDQSGEWYEHFIYNRICIPTSHARRKHKLTWKTNALYWRLVRLAKPVERMSSHLVISPTVGSIPKKINKSYLSRGLRFDPATIAVGLETLKELDLIRLAKLQNNYFGVGIPPLNEEQLGWWEDLRKEPELVGFPELFGLPAAITPKAAKPESPQVKLLIRHGISGKLQREILTLSKELSLADCDWASLLQRCALDHESKKDSQRAKGGRVVVHPGFLFRYELKKRLRQHEEQQANRDREPICADEMYAVQKLAALDGIPKGFIEETRRIIRTQVVFDGDTPLPCKLSWDDVEADLALCNGKFETFGELIAKRLFRNPNEPNATQQPVRQAEPLAEPQEPKRLDGYFGDLRDYVAVSLARGCRLENAVRTECLKHGPYFHKHHDIILEALNRLGAASRKPEENQFCETVDAVLVEQGMAKVFKPIQAKVEIKPEPTQPADHSDDDLLDELRRLG